MKKLILLGLLLAGLLPCVWGQDLPLAQPTFFVTTNPTGACADGAGLRYNIDTGVLTGCINGTWGAVGGVGTAAGIVYRGIFSGLPAASASSGGFAIITDGLNASCAAGSGSLKCVLEDAGSSWATFLGGAAYLNVGTNSTDVAAGNRGVTNGDSHDHNGGDGGAIALAATATALAADPTDCAVTNTFATTIAATGNLTCAYQTLPPNPQTGTSYTILSTDLSKFLTFSNASAIAVTVPQATGSFASGFWFIAKNIGTADATLTPTTSTISGTTSIVLGTGEWAIVRSDGTNWEAISNRATAGSNVTLTRSRTGVQIAASGSGLACATGSGAPSTGAADTCYRDTSQSPPTFWWFVATDTPLLILTSSGTGPVNLSGLEGDACAADIPADNYCLRSDGQRLIIEDDTETERPIPTTDQIQSGETLLVTLSSSGTDTFVGTLTPAITAYTNGMQLQFRANQTCSGAASINVNGVGVKSIFAPNGTSDPTCTSGRDHTLVYDSSLASAAGAFRVYEMADPGSGSGASASGPYLVLGSTKYLPLMYAATVPPALTNLNFGGGTTGVANADGSVTLTVPTGTSGYNSMVGGTFTTDATLALGCMMVDDSGGVRCAFVLRESSTGKLAVFRIQYRHNGYAQLTNGACYTADGATYAGADFASAGVPDRPFEVNPALFWLKVTLVSTTYTYSLSNNGIDFVAIGTNAKTQCFTTGANQVGIGIVNPTANTQYLKLYSMVVN